MTRISDHTFLKAYRMARETKLRFPPDIMLLFYAYYKRATRKNSLYVPEGSENLRDSFKANALLQVQHISPVQAREKYVEMVEKHIGKV